MNRVQLSAVPPQPWRNGGGSTRELLAWPAAADWKLRVSLATIAQDGVREIAPRAIAFHAARLAPNWNKMEKVSKIGNHVFYR